MPQGGNLPFGLAPSGSLTSYTPTLRERATDWMRRKLFSDDRAGQGRAEKVMDVASFTPFGFGLDMYDAGREAGQGNLGAAGTTLAMSFAPGPSPKKIRAFHGSPHDFDRFDMSKIGTGEGAQAYGHGLYFAEAEDVAHGYRDRIAGADWVDKRGVPQMTNSIMEDVVAELRKDGMGLIDAEETASFWSLVARNGDGVENLPGYQSIKNVLDLKGIQLRPKGRMYEVNINADPDTFLDWDKPLPADSPFRARLEEFASPAVNAANPHEQNMGKAAQLAARKPDLSGESYYRTMSGIMDSNRARLREKYGQQADDLPVEELMRRELGTPGIKYLDAGSRGAGDGTRNYVVFDDRLIEIVRKYGIAGASAILGYNLLDGMDPAQAEELKRLEGNQ